MSILSKLASSLGRRDEAPNEELAREIVASGDQKAVAELVENLKNRNKDIRNDCIKVLYEIGGAAPEQIAPHAEVFVELLGHKDNRMQWGAMAALDALTPAAPAFLYDRLDRILAASDGGSVITKDHAVNILIRLAAYPAYAENALPLLREQILRSPGNQVPMYAERSLPVIPAKEKAAFADAMRSRLPDLEKESKRARLEKVIKKLG